MTPTRARLSQCLTAALFMVGVGLAHAATANAEWDIGKYDSCMKQTVRDPATCCLLSGGNIDPRDANNCQAPAALEQGLSPQQQNTWQVPDGTLPTRAFQPDGPTNEMMPNDAVGQP